MSTTIQREAHQPIPIDVSICPCCKMTLEGPHMHGWVKEYRLHTDHTGHYRRYGYCEVPCPECTRPAQARQQAEQIANLLGNSHIPHYMEHWSFATTPAEVDQHALHTCQAFASGTLPERGLFVQGELGVGKTGLAISMLRSVIERGEPAAFLRSLDLLNRLRDAVAKARRLEPGDGDALLTLAKTVRWLVLDDLATERPTAFVLEQLYALIGARRSAGLYTIVTCNFNLAQLEAQWRPTGVPAGGFHAGRRVVERLGEYCLGVTPRNGNLRRRGTGAV